MSSNHDTNSASDHLYSLKTSIGSSLFNVQLNHGVPEQQQLLFDNRQAHLQPPTLTQTGQVNFGALLSLSQNGSSLCDNMHRLCSASAIQNNSSVGQIHSIGDHPKVYLHNELIFDKFQLDNQVAKAPFAFPHRNSLGSSNNSQHSLMMSNSSPETSQTTDLINQNRFIPLPQASAPSDSLTNEIFDNNRFSYGRTSTGSSGHSDEFSNEIGEDSGHSLNSSSDGDSATFGHGVAGASSPLNPRLSHPYRHFECMNQPDDEETKSGKEDELHGEFFISGDLDCRPNLDLENVQSSSMKALLSGRSSLNYSDSAPKEVFDAFAFKRRVSSGNEHPFAHNGLFTTKSVSNLSSGQRTSRTKQNGFFKCSTLKNIDEESSFIQNDLKNTVTFSSPSLPIHCKPTSNELLLPLLFPPRVKQQPFPFNMDHVIYVTSETRAQQVVERVLHHHQLVSISCESDCDLRRRIDLLSLAVVPQKAAGVITETHPQIFVFDVRYQPMLIQKLQPLFSSANVIKVMFDSRLTLRLLKRVYGVYTFVGLFDVQLAYRVLMAKLTGRPFNQVNREQLIHVAWQCNGPPMNFQRPVSRPDQQKVELTCHSQFCKPLSKRKHSKNKLPYWSVRPVNVQILYNAAYDAFMLVPQLAANLMSMMELVLSDRNKQFFKQLGDELISRHLVERNFFSFEHRHEYLNELQRQVSLLTVSASVDKFGTTSASNFTGECLLHTSQTGHKLDELPGARICGHVDRMGCESSCVRPEEFLLQSAKHEQSIWEFKSSSFSSFSLADDVAKPNQLSLNSKNDWTVASRRIKCKCNQESNKQLQSEAKCMNLLVDQIIDLIEMKDDFQQVS